MQLTALPRVAPVSMVAIQKEPKRGRLRRWEQATIFEETTRWRQRTSQRFRRAHGSETQNINRKTNVLAFQFEQGLHQPHEKWQVQVWVPYMHEMFASKNMVQQLAMPMGRHDQRWRPPWQRLAVVAWRRHQAPILWMHVQRPFWALKFCRIRQTAINKKHVGLVVEIFPGTCRLSKACRKYGLRALPVDKDPKRAEHCAVATYDLTDPEQHTTLVAVLQAKKYMLVHAYCAPICGTDSLAFHYTNNRSLSVVTTTQTVFQILVTLSAIDLTVQTGRAGPQPACS